MERQGGGPFMYPNCSCAPWYPCSVPSSEWDTPATVEINKNNANLVDNNANQQVGALLSRLRPQQCMQWKWRRSRSEEWAQAAMAACQPQAARGGKAHGWESMDPPTSSPMHVYQRF